MPIEFRCSQCGRLLQTPDDSGGRQAKCPECGAIQPIPMASAPPDAPLASPPASSAQSPFAGTVLPEAPHDANNPFQPPQYAGGPIPSMGAEYRQYARDRLQSPAIGLIVTSVIGIGLQLLNLMFAAVGPQRFPGMNNPNMRFAPVPSPVGVGLNLLAILLAVLVIYGAIKMKNLESYTLAMTASILALIPCTSPCCCLGLPIGIWALVVLVDTNVKSAFRT
jgi:hypothetical protein